MELSKMVEAVARGAEWLDRVYPEWVTKVDPAVLNMAYGDLCVLGQIFSNTRVKQGYSVVLEWLFPGELRSVRAQFQTWAATNGFNLPGCQPCRDYGVLGDLWLEAIKVRLDAGISL
jgi:hypothetical protein